MWGLVCAPPVHTPSIDEANVVDTSPQIERPFRLVVTGEAEDWLPALSTLIAPEYVELQRVDDDRELMDVVQSRGADAAVLDDQVKWAIDGLKLLRMIRRFDQSLPVVVVTRHGDSRFLQSALKLRAYSVVRAPLEFEQLVRQIHGMMIRMDRMLRRGRPGEDPFAF